MCDAIPDPVRPGPTTISVRAALAGDTSAWRTVFDRPMLFQARVRWRDRLAWWGDPEDVVAEAWANVLERIEDFVPRGARTTPSLVALFATTIRNKLSDLEKLTAERMDRREGQTAFQRVAHPTRSVPTKVVRREAQLLAERALDALDTSDREIIVTIVLEGVPHAQYAKLLELSIPASRKRLQRALARLRQQMPGSVFAEFDEFVDPRKPAPPRTPEH